MCQSLSQRWLLWGLLAFLAGAGSATAQAPYYPRPTNPYSQPTISPYLNLLRGGDPAANYFLLVRPQFQQRAFNAQVGSALQSLDQKTTDPTSPAVSELVPSIGTTGHPVGFLNYGSYYNLGPTARPGAQAPPINRGRR